MSCPANACSPPGYFTCICPAGMYFSTALGCVPCTPNSFSALGSVTCSPCPTNTYSLGVAGACSASIGYFFWPTVTGPFGMTQTTFVNSENGIVFSVTASNYTNGNYPFNVFSGTPGTSISSTYWQSYGNSYTTAVGNVNLYSPSWAGYQTMVDGITVAGDWIQVQSSSPIPLSTYWLQADSVQYHAMPVSFLLAGSNDGLNWVALDNQTNVPAFTSNSIQIFNVPGMGFSFITYRLIVTGLPNTPQSINSAVIAGWELFYATLSPCTGTCAPGLVNHCDFNSNQVCCGAGTFFVDGYSSACQQCPAGSYGTGTTACTLCTTGTYSIGSGAPCVSCPANSNSFAGASSCVANPGYYTNASGSIVLCGTGGSGGVPPLTYSQCTTTGLLTKCGSGTYWIPSQNSSGCTKCPIGTYGIGNQTSCTLCPAGKYANATGAGACAACGSGQTSLAGASACTPPSAVGKYYSAFANSSLPCPTGFYCLGGAWGPQACYQCVLGTFTLTTCNATTNTTCAPCPAGSYCSNPAALSLTSACSAGNYCPARSWAQSQCAAGFYCPNSTVEIQCSVIGTSCPAGSTAPVQCPAGYYCPNTFTQAQCTTGSYCPVGSSTQSPCPASYYCTNPSTIAPCTSGYYCPSGTSAQTRCLQGYYCNNTATQVACALTNYCPTGTTSPALCAAGYYCKNTYTQTACPIQSYCPAGSTSIQFCPAGFYCSTPSSKMACPTNSYCLANSTAASNCTVCKPGNYTSSLCNATSNAVCKACQAGFNYSSIANASSCTACSACVAGQYITSVCNVTANTVCAVCPAGSYCPSSSTQTVIACVE